jgi:tetratricopeptide (TPR) repeat protein
VLGALKEVSQDHPGAGKPANSANETAICPDESDSGTPDPDKHLTFIISPPGRWIRRMGWGVGCALALVASLVHAELNPGKFETANDAFAQGRFSEAARGYESIIAQQGWSAPVLFNLANAQQRAGQIGQAILNYERAALLAPGDSDIAANLRLARQKAGLATEPRSWSESVKQLLTLNGWFCFAAVALFLMAVTLPLKQLRPGMSQALNRGSAPAVFALALATMAMAVHWPDLNRAVIIVPEATAGVSPVTMAQPVFKLRAGEAVRLKLTHGAFALLENGAGHEGWVKASEVARVIPSPRHTAMPRS